MTVLEMNMVGNEYVLDENDEIKINGDVEKFNIGI